MSQFKNKITQINVELGFMRINKANSEYFPKGKESLKIQVYLKMKTHQYN